MRTTAPLILFLGLALPAAAWAQESGPAKKGAGKTPIETQEDLLVTDELKLEDESKSKGLTELLKDWGLGSLRAYVRSCAATRFHDRVVTPEKTSEKWDLAAQENTLWVELTNEKLFKVDWLDLKLLGRVKYDSAFALNKDIDVESARDDLEFEAALREAYVKLKFGDFTFKAGRQIVVWGESDIFRVTDWANPVDLRRGFFGDLEALREPLWMVTSQYGSRDFGIELVVNPGDYQDDLVAKPGSEFYPSEAYAELRHNTFLTTNAKVREGVLARTPPQFHAFVPSVIVPEENFIYIYEDEKPHRQLRNSEVGVRLRYRLGDWDLGLSYVNTIPDRPVLQTKEATFNPGPDDPQSGTPGAFTPQDNTMTIVTRLRYPRMNVVGLSFNKDLFGGVLRGEFGTSIGESFTQKTDAGLDIVKRNVFRATLGFDIPLFIPLLSPDRTAMLSFQVYEQYVPHARDHNIVEVPFQDEVRSWETSFSVVARFYYFSDALQPQLTYVRDLKGSQLIGGKVTYRVSNHWEFGVEAAFFDGPGNHGFGLFDKRDQLGACVTFYF